MKSSIMCVAVIMLCAMLLPIMSIPSLHAKSATVHLPGLFTNKDTCAFPGVHNAYNIAEEYKTSGIRADAPTEDVNHLKDSHTVMNARAERVDEAEHLLSIAHAYENTLPFILPSPPPKPPPSCVISAFLEKVDLKKFPITAMENETVRFNVAVTDDGKTITNGECHIDVLNPAGETVFSRLNTNLSGGTFTASVRLPGRNSISAGRWTAVAVWNNSSLSLTGITAFRVLKMSVEPKDIFSRDGLNVDINGRVSEESGLSSDSDISVFAVGGHDPFYPRMGNKSFLISGLECTIGISPFPHACPGDRVLVSCRISSKIAQKQNVTATASLRLPLIVEENETTTKKTVFTVSSTETQPNTVGAFESIVKTMTLAVPKLGETGNHGIMPLRLSANYLLQIDLATGVERTTESIPFMILPDESRGRYIAAGYSTNVPASGDFSLRLTPDIKSFRMMMLATKPSGEFLCFFKNISLVKPAFKSITHFRENSNIRIAAEVNASNVVSYVLFQYRKEGTHEQTVNISLDINATNGWSCIWNVTGLEPGDYLINITATDELGLTVTATIGINLPGPPPDNLPQIAVAVLLAVTVCVITAVPASRRMSRWMDDRRELRRIQALKKIDYAGNPRVFMGEAVSIFIALCRRYENLDFPPNWTISRFREALDQNKLMVKSANNLLSDYQAIRFGLRNKSEESALNTVDDLCSFRSHLIERRELRKRNESIFTGWRMHATSGRQQDEKKNQTHLIS